MTKTSPKSIVLSLDFDLETDEERTQFLHDYISQNPSISPSELEMLANYALWGRDKDSQRSPVEEGYILEPARRSAWKKPKETSLELVLESGRPVNLYPLTAENTYRNPPMPTFSRDEARKEAPSSILRALEALWTHIDQLDYTIQTYDILQENRADYSKDFSHVATAALKKSASQMSHRDRTEKYRLLVELRREQFTYRDTYKPTPRRRTSEHHTLVPSLSIRPYPFDPICHTPLSEHLPSLHSLQILQICNIWKEDKNPPLCEGEVLLDLTDPTIVTPLLPKLLLLEDLSESDTDPFSPLLNLHTLLTYYISQMHLSPIHRRILELRTTTSHPLSEVREIINSEFGKTYTLNYLSTLYTQKFVPHFIEIVKAHYRVLTESSNPSSFQSCRLCGHTKLLDPLFFTINRRMKTGYSTACKACEKELRDSKKEIKNAAN